jgi:hypothetical protein
MSKPQPRQQKKKRNQDSNSSGNRKKKKDTRQTVIDTDNSMTGGDPEDFHSLTYEQSCLLASRYEDKFGLGILSTPGARHTTQYLDFMSTFMSEEAALSLELENASTVAEYLKYLTPFIKKLPTFHLHKKVMSTYNLELMKSVLQVLCDKRDTRQRASKYVSSEYNDLLRNRESGEYYQYSELHPEIQSLFVAFLHASVNEFIPLTFIDSSEIMECFYEISTFMPDNDGFFKMFLVCLNDIFGPHGLETPTYVHFISGMQHVIPQSLASPEHQLNLDIVYWKHVKYYKNDEYEYTYSDIYPFIKQADWFCFKPLCLYNDNDAVNRLYSHIDENFWQPTVLDINGRSGKNIPPPSSSSTSSSSSSSSTSSTCIKKNKKNSSTSSMVGLEYSVGLLSGKNGKNGESEKLSYDEKCDNGGNSLSQKTNKKRRAEDAEDQTQINYHPASKQLSKGFMLFLSTPFVEFLFIFILLSEF